MLSGHKPLSFATHASGMVKQSSFSWGRGAQDDEIPQVHQSQSTMNHDKIFINFRFARLASNPCSTSLNRSVTVSVFCGRPGFRVHRGRNDARWPVPCPSNCVNSFAASVRAKLPQRRRCVSQGNVWEGVGKCFNMFQHVSTPPPQEITGK